MKVPGIKESWDISVNSAADLVKNNKVITGAIAGAATGTLLIPIPIVGTLIGVAVGVTVAQRIKDNANKE
jgi:phage tail tape-measure protein